MTREVGWWPPSNSDLAPEMKVGLNKKQGMGGNGDEDGSPYMGVLNVADQSRSQVDCICQRAISKLYQNTK